MFASRSFAVVMLQISSTYISANFCNDKPVLSSLLPPSSQSGYTHLRFIAFVVIRHIYFARFSIHGTNEGIVCNVFKMTLVFKPFPRRGYVVCCTLTPHLDQHTQIREFVTSEAGKRFKNLKT